MNNFKGSQSLYISPRKFMTGDKEYSLGLEIDNDLKEPVVVVFLHDVTGPEKITPGWLFSHIFRCSHLWINGSKNWYVTPTWEDWNSLEALYKSKKELV